MIVSNNNYAMYVYVRIACRKTNQMQHVAVIIIIACTMYLCQAVPAVSNGYSKYHNIILRRFRTTCTCTKTNITIKHY